MTTELSVQDASLVREVIENAELRTIDFHEVSARRYDTQPHEGDEGKLTITVEQRTGVDDFGVRLIATVIAPGGEASATVAGNYELQPGSGLSVRALRLFANEVAVMTVFPHLREAIATITAKVFGAPIMLPLIERGQIALELEDDDRSR